jgi:hypothetical protein
MWFRRGSRRHFLVALTRTVGLACLLPLAVSGAARAQKSYVFNDSHFHLTNYIQEAKILQILSDCAGRQLV